MTDNKLSRAPTKSTQSFLDQLAKLPSVAAKGCAGRLVFALDATASREPTWRAAQQIHGEMFNVAASLGGLEIQLCYYRGLTDFHAGSWLMSAKALRTEMARVDCLGGYTQIVRVLEHVQAETRRCKVNALVFVGDCMEEDVDLICQRAGELGLLGVRAFLFQEGNDRTAERGFRQIAQLTQGAYSRFDARSAGQLRQLLGAVAAYAAGGLPAFESFSRNTGGAALQLANQLKRT